VAKATGPTYKVPFRRRREGFTDYRKRLALIKSGLPRMVVRKSGRGIAVQFIVYSPKGDMVVASAMSASLRKYGWPPRRNAPTAYLTGLLGGKLAAKKGVSDFVLDIGMSTPSKGAIVFAALKGAIDGGLKTAYDKEMIREDAITGTCISNYAKLLKSGDKLEKRFSGYTKEGIDPERIGELFSSSKEQIERL